jgi:hypothetical protein
MSSINDIWRTINIGFYTYKDKEKIPPSPGSYAWYCPLDIKSNNYDEFIQTYKTVFEYDSKKEASLVIRKTEIELPWKTLKQSLEIALKQLPKERSLSNCTIEDLWHEINNDKALLRKFRIALLKSSILLPPLYVGKTNNLAKRHREHCESDINSEKGSFKKRFMNHVAKNNINIDFEDLIFFATTLEDLPPNSEEFLEEILKLFSQPIYSVR